MRHSKNIVKKNRINFREVVRHGVAEELLDVVEHKAPLLDGFDN